MKKNVRRLTLKKETLRSLTDVGRQAAQVRGGADTDECNTEASVCWSHPSCFPGGCDYSAFEGCEPTQQYSCGACSDSCYITGCRSACYGTSCSDFTCPWAGC
jgi:hypothetical protein